ncbi:uncharacterized protein V6R79_014538 [Siganus canaliculatus]
MASRTPLYELFDCRFTAARASMDVLVSAWWWRLFSGKVYGQNHRLNDIYTQLSQWPELAALPLCPYYFSQVTYSLPTRDQVKHMENSNLRLHCFDSWADMRQERQRSAELQRRRRLRANQNDLHWNGIYLSRLCQLQDLSSEKSIATEDYIYLMYGCRL